MSTLAATVTLDRTQNTVVTPQARHAVTGNFLTGIDQAGNLPLHRVDVTLDRTQNRIVTEVAWR